MNIETKIQCGCSYVQFVKYGRGWKASLIRVIEQKDANEFKYEEISYLHSVIERVCEGGLITDYYAYFQIDNSIYDEAKVIVEKVFPSARQYVSSIQKLSEDSDAEVGSEYLEIYQRENDIRCFLYRIESKEIKHLSSLNGLTVDCIRYKFVGVFNNENHISIISQGGGPSGIINKDYWAIPKGTMDNLLNIISKVSGAISNKLRSIDELVDFANSLPENKYKEQVWINFGPNASYPMDID